MRALIVLFLISVLGGCAATPMHKAAEKASPLALSPPVSDKTSPQMAKTPIRWEASARGGVGALTYEFSLHDGSTETVRQKGPSSTWQWTPAEAGVYRVRVVVRDSLGNEAESGWTAEFVITPTLDARSLIVVLPFENLSGRPAPLQELRETLIDAMEKKGLRILDEKTLKDFMKRHRIRYTGGISRRTAEMLKEETGADAVLITNMDLYKEKGPPKIALISRLVLSGERPHILWVGNSAATGDESPGLLGLGLIEDRNELVKKAFTPLVDSLARYFSGKDWITSENSKEKLSSPSYYSPVLQADGEADRDYVSKFAPKVYYRSPEIEPRKKYAVVVVPFYDISGRKGAGQIMALHFVEQLMKVDALRVIEPGVVRQELLRYRVIFNTGVSLSDTDLLFDKLDADLVVAGRVFEYLGFQGVPKVDFSVEVIERSSRRAVWTSRSYNEGDEGVFFFDAGRVRSAHVLVSEMVSEITSKLFGE